MPIKFGNIGRDALTLDINAAPYNARPDAIAGVDNGAQAKIQQCFDDANALRITGKRVRVTNSIPGIYTMPLGIVPTQAAPAAKAAMVWFDSKIWYDFYDCEFRLKAGEVLPAGCNNGYLATGRNVYSGTTQKGVKITGLTLNGTADLQTVDGGGIPRLKAALAFVATEDIWVENVVVKNFLGTLSSPPGETMHMDVNRCANFKFINCVVDGSECVINPTATGFSSNNSIRGLYLGCLAKDMAKGVGYTAWKSSDISYVDTDGWRISNSVAFGAGFGVTYNAERSKRIFYTNAMSGGKAVNMGASNPFMADYGDLTCRSGFQITGCRDVHGVNCSARDSINYGIRVQKNPGAPDPAGVGDTTNGSAVLTNVTQTTSGAIWEIDITVVGTGIPANTTVIGVDLDGANTLRLSAPATATAAGVALTGALNCQGVFFQNMDLAGSATPVSGMDSAQLDVHITARFSATLNGYIEEWGTATIRRSRFGNSGLRRIPGTSTEQIERWLNFDGTVNGGFNSAKQFMTTGIQRAYRNITANTTLTTQDDMVFVSTTGVVATLPTVAASAPSSAGLAGNSVVSIYTIKNRAAGNVSIHPQSGNIDGVGGDLTVTPGTTVRIFNDGTNWFTI